MSSQLQDTHLCWAFLPNSLFRKWFLVAISNLSWRVKSEQSSKRSRDGIEFFFKTLTISFLFYLPVRSPKCYGIRLALESTLALGASQRCTVPVLSFAEASSPREVSKLAFLWVSMLGRHYFAYLVYFLIKVVIYYICLHFFFKSCPEFSTSQLNQFVATSFTCQAYFEGCLSAW